MTDFTPDRASLLTARESQTVERQEAWGDDCLKALAALANTQGGTLVIGVTADGHNVSWNGDGKEQERAKKYFIGIYRSRACWHDFCNVSQYSELFFAFRIAHLNRAPVCLSQKGQRKYMSPRSLWITGLLVSSSAVFALPAQAQFTAYAVPAGAVSNQFITSSLGMDFNVNAPIQITSLGVFDANQNGLAFATPVYIYDRTTQLAVVSLVIPAGTSTTLIGGSRFVNLVTPFTLNAGFQGSIVEDVNTTDGNFNTSGGVNPATTNTGGGLISFVGGGRYGSTGIYPATGDSGPANRYDAGTFQFTAAVAATTPEPSSLAILTGLSISGGLFLKRRKRTVN